MVNPDLSPSDPWLQLVGGASTASNTASSQPRTIILQDCVWQDLNTGQLGVPFDSLAPLLHFNNISVVLRNATHQRNRRVGPQDVVVADGGAQLRVRGLCVTPCGAVGPGCPQAACARGPLSLSPCVLVVSSCAAPSLVSPPPPVLVAPCNPSSLDVFPFCCQYLTPLHTVGFSGAPEHYLSDLVGLLVLLSNALLKGPP